LKTINYNQVDPVILFSGQNYS